MSKLSDEFKASFDGTKYPAAFLEKYRVLECLSATAQGETLLVCAEETERFFIAKVTVGNGDNAEATLLKGLSHPALPEMYDSFSEGDTHILVREFIKGTPLDKAILERPFSNEEATHIGAQLCDVLSYLHCQTPPVIHRDVKPGNVILGADGKVTLIDFGIARTYKADAKKDTVFSGTNDFAPPEQYGFSQTDARADIFSLGMLLKYLLTRGDLDAEITDRRLRRIVSRCTAFAPQKRYANAEAVKWALLSWRMKTAQRIVTAAALTVVLCCGILIGRYCLPYIPPAPVEAVAAADDTLTPTPAVDSPAPAVEPAAVVSFADPIVENAARLMLGKPEGELTYGELAAVTELYIVGDAATTNEDDFFTTYFEWNSHGHSGEPIVQTLADIAYFPNLTELCIVAGAYTDLTPLAGCKNLKKVDLFNNYELTDISVFGSLDELTFIGAVACPYIDDIEPLVGLPKLRTFDLTGSQGLFDPAPLAQMGDFDMLMLKGSKNAHSYIGGKRIGWLQLSETDIDSLEPLATVTGLDILELWDTPISDLTGIGVHTRLRKLNIAHTAVTDLTPLKELPDLTELILSEDMDVDVSVLADMPGLTITYQ